MLVSKNAKICIIPNANFKNLRYPNVSQWNIGCVWSQTQNFRICHVHFIFVGVDFICVGSGFSVEYGLKALEKLSYTLY